MSANWEADALCATTDPELFHPSKDGGSAQVARARAICAKCPVQLECLEDAPVWDVWSVRAGLTGMQRQKLRGKAA